MYPTDYPFGIPIFPPSGGGGEIPTDPTFDSLKVNGASELVGELRLGDYSATVGNSGLSSDSGFAFHGSSYGNIIKGPALIGGVVSGGAYIRGFNTDTFAPVPLGLTGSEITLNPGSALHINKSLTGTSGASSGQFLPVTVYGTQYVIELLAAS